MEASANLPPDDRDSEQIMDKDNEEEELRRSGRLRNPTEKMLAFHKEEAHKKEKRLTHIYEQWKTQAHKAREQLKVNIPQSDIAALIDTLEDGKCYRHVYGN